MIVACLLCCVLFAALGGTQRSVAQSVYYFEVDQADYQPLANAVPLTSGQPWDDPVFAAPLGFEFPLFDEQIDTLYAGEGAGAVLHSLPVQSQPPVSTGLFLAPYSADLIDNGSVAGNQQRPVISKTEGEAGSRIFKIEWPQAGFYNEFEQTGNLTDFVNVQLWLYQDSGIIEYRYGPNSVQNATIAFSPSTGPFIGVSDEATGTVILLTGSPTDPAIAIGASDETQPLDGTPADGTIYRFLPLLSTTERLAEQQAFALRPSAEGMLIESTDSADFEVEVYTLNGQRIGQFNSSGAAFILKTDQIDSPLFLVRCMDRNGRTVVYRLAHF